MDTNKEQQIERLIHYTLRVGVSISATLLTVGLFIVTVRVHRRYLLSLLQARSQEHLPGHRQKKNGKDCLYQPPGQSLANN